MAVIDKLYHHAGYTKYCLQRWLDINHRKQLVDATTDMKLIQSLDGPAAGIKSLVTSPTVLSNI